MMNDSFKKDRLSGLADPRLFFSLSFYVAGAALCAIAVSRYPEIGKSMYARLYPEADLYSVFSVSLLPAMVLLIGAFLRAVRFTVPLVMSFSGFCAILPAAVCAASGRAEYAAAIFALFPAVLVNVFCFTRMSLCSIEHGEQSADKRRQTLSSVLILFGVCVLYLALSSFYLDLLFPRVFKLILSLL